MLQWKTAMIIVVNLIVVPTTAMLMTRAIAPMTITILKTTIAIITILVMKMGII